MSIVYDVGIYCRLSDEDQNKETEFSESINNQKKLLVEYANNRGWNIKKIYIDDDYSGLSENRPEFIKMIQDTKNGAINLILCKHQSRFSRNIETTERYLNNYFIRWNVRFVSVVDNIDTFDKRSTKTRQINSLINEWYSQDLSESIRSILEVKQRQGKFIGAFPPFGYIKDINDKNKLVVDHKLEPIIKEIFNLYKLGVSTSKIATILNEKGVLTPALYKKKNYKEYNKVVTMGKWNKTTVKRILKNQVYIGNMVQHKREKLNYKSNKICNLPKSQWTVVYNTHEPIISKAVFDFVQNKIDTKSRITKSGRTHVYDGMVYCGVCKEKLNYISNGKYTYLRCLKRNKCSSIPIKILEELLYEKLMENGIKAEKIQRNILIDNIDKIYIYNEASKKNSIKVEFKK